MEKCAEIKRGRRTLLSCREVRGNPAALYRKSQLNSSVNCVQTFAPIKPTVFKVDIKNKYEIRATEQCPFFKQAPDSSQPNLGEVTWRITNSTPALLNEQTTQSRHTTTESRRCPSRSTSAIAKTPAENKMSFMTAYGTKCGLLERTSSRASSCCSPTFAKNESEIRELKFQSLDDELEKLIQQIIDEQHITREEINSPHHAVKNHLSRKEVVFGLPCRQAELNVRESLHLYLPTHDIQEEEEFTNTGGPPEDVSQNLEDSNGDLNGKQNWKKAETKQEEKNGCRIKDSAWASPSGSRLKDQMQRGLPCVQTSAPAPAVNVNSIEQKKYSELLDDPWNRLNQTQPLKHDYVNHPMVDLTIYDLEAELDNIYSVQENIHIKNLRSNTNEHLTLASSTENDKEKIKIFGTHIWKPQYYVVSHQTNFLDKPQDIHQKQHISRVHMARNMSPHAKQ
ncbi:uncharacterized protein LOC119955838 isoform X1 [Scyliorhinus canicula]|uniref:uncharacterized protein LOC119955838 isoform X1 n=1 Tax=Scyliorhinus canicula TaxID=7830 RepID=UPI0018F6A646|nr:uncharacterized protein LOC119955838 isoform X1 [Scyliorhinus canicula]